MLGTLSPAEIEALLEEEFVARIGCHAEGRTYVVPITYAYERGALLGHSAEGLKLQMMRQNPFVCIEVDHIDNLANWRSVIARGRFEELFDEAASAALVALRERFRSRVVSQTTAPAESLLEGEAPLQGGNGHACFFRIHLSEMTGRFERR